MASIRNLKKDISFVTSEIVIECFTYNYLFPDKNHEELAKIISDSLEMQKDLLHQINAVKKDKEISAKKQFKEIRKQFKQKIEDIVKRLNALSIE
jgi:hypothetical protein